MKKTILITILMLTIEQVLPFCGLYVAKADAALFNNKSEIILVRDGRRTVITMSNDFQGDVKDFAMVVPVPEILRERDIRIVEGDLFSKLDAYSSPRLVEYYDQDPCPREIVQYDMDVEDEVLEMAPRMLTSPTEAFSHDLGVTVEAIYQKGEYDILILSATESSGLKKWLLREGYKIPVTADAVLEPYIKSEMKFFVVKVNLAEKFNIGFDYLRPLQIEFESDKFMLPIRLGMANADGAQDMVVYAFTKTGRIETANYRTTKIPTDRNIPLFVKQDFGDFYVDAFGKSYGREGKNSVFLEYAWNVSPQWTGAKCDPCVGQPPIFEDFQQSGANWAGQGGSTVFFTRLHVRYTRDKFPQDLQFIETPNKEHFQGRYILTHPAPSAFDCEAGQSYLHDLQNLRKREVDELVALTGWPAGRYKSYLQEYSSYRKKEENPMKREFDPILKMQNDDGSTSFPRLILACLTVVLLLILGYVAAYKWQMLRSSSIYEHQT